MKLDSTSSFIRANSSSQIMNLYIR